MKNILPIALTATAITFALFSFMAFLINKDQKTTVAVDSFIPVEVAQIPPDSKKSVIVRVKPTPPPPLKQPPRSIVEADPSEINNSISYSPSVIKTSGIKTSLNNSGQLSDNDARPVIQITPKYPISALNNGTQGWVKLAFNINQLGEVFGVRVIDSKPKRVFDKAARKALKKWKYRAKTVNGNAIEQHNLTVQLDFKIDSNQG